MVADRPSWMDTLSGDLPDPLDADLAALTADIDKLGALIARFRDSDPPPEDPPPAAAAKMAA